MSTYIHFNGSGDEPLVVQGAVQATLGSLAEDRKQGFVLLADEFGHDVWVNPDAVAYMKETK